MSRMVVTDFDGTLLRSDGTFCEGDLGALRDAGRRGLIRVIATGRSLFSLRRAVEIGSLPVDYVVFSTGAGVIRLPGEELIRASRLEAEQVAHAAGVLTAAGLDYMVHAAVPENHRFHYHDTGGAPADFHRRIGLYPDHSGPIQAPLDELGPAAQLLAVVPASRGETLVHRLRDELAGFTVVRATSPLDGSTYWLEIFPAGVSKSETVAWVASIHDILPGDVVAVGNDYNDRDLLEWAGRGYVTENAPEDLKERFPVVRANDHGGVAQAVRSLLDETR